MFATALKKTFAAAAVAALVSLPVAAFAAAAVGSPAPEFSGKTSEGKTVSLSDYKGKVVVLEWTNPGCPFVRKHYDGKNIQTLQKDYTAKDVIWLTVNSSAKGKQGHLEGDALKGEPAKEGIASTAYISDETGQIGQLYGAKVTPHLFIIGKDGNIAYNGGIDSIASTDPEDISKAEPYVKTALDEVLAGKPVTNATTKPYGCGVKYTDAENHKH
ncbi:MAG: thioredoxin family protein [Alphaproteobacteria bacterium]|nr:thioredoxin family protein [Alphaproteobacteria bacterium]